MKTSFVLLAAVGAVMAQADVPECGQVCVSNMVNIAQTQFGCGSGDIACYCKDERFGFGLRDCSAAVCSAEDAAKVVSYGATYCQQGIASLVSSVSSVAAGASSTGAIGILTSELASATATQSASGSGTVTVVSTTTLVTTTGTASEAASSVASSASDAASSIASSASDAASSVASEASSAASSAASAASSAAESATGNAAPMVTAFPLAGAAGIAAMFFL